MIVLSAMMCCGQEKENNRQTNKIQKEEIFRKRLFWQAEGWRQEVKIQSWKKGLPTSAWWKQHLGKAIRNQGQDKEGTSNAKAYLSTM